MIRKINYIFTKKDKVKILILVIMMIAGSLLELLSVAVFSPFIDIIMNPEKLFDSDILSVIYYQFNFKNIEMFLVLITIGIIAIYVIKNIYTIIEKNLIYKFSYRFQQNLSTGLLTAYMHEPYTFHLNKNISILQRSMQEDTDQFTKGIIHVMEMIAEIFV